MGEEPFRTVNENRLLLRVEADPRAARRNGWGF